jgi:hypothetical protein
MKDIKQKIEYIYVNIDALYYFLLNNGVNDHSKRCILRRFFILFDSYVEMIGFLKNELSKNNKIDLNNKKFIENIVKDIKTEWDNNYEIIRNKFSAHHQNVNELKLIEWWNEIDYSTITFFYDKIKDIKSILSENNCISLRYITDFSNLDFSGSCLEEINEGSFYISSDRLWLSKKNTGGPIPLCEFQRKCMLILSIIDCLFISFSVTKETENYDSLYKNILFDTAWLLICCDTLSLIENMYDDGDYGDSLLTLSSDDWKGKSIIQDGKTGRNQLFENQLKKLRDKFAAHIDTKDDFSVLCDYFYHFNLSDLYEYCNLNLIIFQKACSCDIRTKMFVIHNHKLPGNIISMSHTGYKPI